MTAFRRVRLGEVATIEREIVEPAQIETGTMFVGLENIESGGQFVNVRPVDSGELASSKFVFTPRHILYGKLRPYLAKIARPDFEGICSTDILPVLPGPELDRSYLAWLLLTPEMVTRAASRATGANLPRLSPSALLEMPIPLPPLPEQQRIAAILDQADALRTKRRAALAQLDTLTQAIFLDMFGDPLTNPEAWPSARFAKICERITVGIVVKPSSYYVENGIPALRSLNVKPGKILLQDLVYFSESDNEKKLFKTRLKAGDLVLVRSGQPGTAAVVPRELDGINAIDLLIATPLHDYVDVTYLCEFFNSSGGRDLVLSRQRGQVQKHLNVGSLNEAIIPLPPLLLQREFAKRVAVLEKAKASHRSALSEHDSLFASLQQRAFRGEL